jgi:hypothetical protein
VAIAKVMTGPVLSGGGVAEFIATMEAYRLAYACCTDSRGLDPGRGATSPKPVLARTPVAAVRVPP